MLLKKKRKEKGEPNLFGARPNLGFQFSNGISSYIRGGFSFLPQLKSPNSSSPFSSVINHHLPSKGVRDMAIHYPLFILFLC